MHEDLIREQEVDGASDRSFGLILAVVVTLYSLAPLLHHNPIRWWALAAAGSFFGLALCFSRVLAPLNRLWSRFGLLLSKLVSPIVLALLYFLTVVPVGLLMSLTGRDPLQLRLDPKAKSYWIPRKPPGPSPASMKNLF
jgi:Saxitoxin biosynthesis operon protein SxtJ